MIGIVKKTNKIIIKKAILLIAGSFINLVAATQVYAASTSSGMPWEDPLNKLLDSLTGPVSRVLGAVAIIGLGIGIAFSDGGSMMQKALWVVMGLAIAFNAISWGLTFIGFSGGLLV
ncbi:MAG: TrbC/VirB2 family protein [Chlorobiaceae bacterium]|nr:TrbC/VirB2 family protein [Chlorobiaceae bacterium]